MRKCEICLLPGSGNHFGVFSCRACAAFFRRGALRKFEYKCKNRKLEQECLIFDAISQQYPCKKCRMDMCLKLGMSVKRFQFGRDCIGPSKTSLTFRPNYLHFVKRNQNKNFVELKFLLEEGEKILLNRNRSISTSSTLLKLSHGILAVRDLPSFHRYRLVLKWGVNEKLKDWETSFLTVANWLTYFDEFQKLPISLRMKILTGMWHLWVLFDKLALNFMARKHKFGSKDILVAGYNTLFNLNNLEINMADFSNHREVNVDKFIRAIDWNMINFIKPLLELTFMISQFCFNYVGKRFQGTIVEISDSFQEILANNLHDYYMNGQNIVRYSGRLAQLMKFVKSLENDILEKQRKVEVGEVFDVWKVEFSHPEVFKDNLS